MFTFKPIHFPNDDFKYIAPSWKHMDLLSLNICQQIVKSGDCNFDRVITLARGGWPIARSIVDYLSIDKIASIGVRLYKGINSQNEEPELYQDLPISVEGERILLVDDVADSGKSLLFVLEYLKNKKVKDVTTATLFYKPRSKVVPDYYAAKTSQWIVFPYDVRDTIERFYSKWRKDLTEQQIVDNLQKLNFSKSIIEYFISLQKDLS